MKRKAVIILTVFYFTSVIFSCSSLGRQDEPQEIKQPETSVSSPANILPSGWKHEVEITHKGSRSEGSVSRLFYRYTEIPAVFECVNIGGSIFEYSPMENIWDNSGYIAAGETVYPELSADILINSGELKRGWYESKAELIKKATPPEWIHVTAEDVGLWISPDKISEMIIIYKLSGIDKSGMLMLKPADNNE